MKVLSEYFVLCFRAGKIQFHETTSYLPLPKELQAKHAWLNIKNLDKKCFLWSILAMLYPVKYRNHPTRVSKYQEYDHELNMSGIQYPADIKDIGKSEHQNNISVNVYGYEDKKNLPVTYYHCDCWKSWNLLYITAD